MIPIIVIEGPTASGKSNLAMALAELLDTEIISADSRQVYTLLNIGTAKPTKDDQSRIKHHLIDFLDPTATYNAGRFVSDASQIITDMAQRKKLPIICGGTGLYVRSLLDGLFEHHRIDEAIRAALISRLETTPLEAMHSELMEVDPEFARRISPTDKQRILRGLEIFYGTGKCLSAHWAEQSRSPKYTSFRILVDPPREVLYQRINSRMEIMVKNGLLQEIQDVINMGYEVTCPGLQSLGYKEYLPYLTEKDSFANCMSKAAQNSRNYAKRQCTWYRKYEFDLTISDGLFTLSGIQSAIMHKLYPRLSVN